LNLAESLGVPNSGLDACWILCVLDSIRAGFDASRIDKAKGLEKEQVPRSAGETPAILKLSRRIH